MKPTIFFKAAALASLLCAGVAQADPTNLIQNGSFETGSTFVNTEPNSMALSAGASTIDNWTVTGSQIAWIANGNYYGLTAQDGNRFLDLTGWNYNGQGGVTQDINTVIGNHYTLGFDLGNSTTYNNWPGATIMASAAGSSNLFTNSTASGDNWQHFNLDFVATGLVTTIALSGQNSQNYVGLDNLSVTAVPEPESYAMLMAGLGLLGFMNRRKRANPEK